MKENVFKLLVAGAVTGVELYFHEMLGPVLVLVIVMLLDWVSGLADAWSRGELSSKVGVLGIVKKVAYMAAVAVAVVVDWVIQTAGAKAGVDIGNFYAFGLLVTIWLVLNECISILENLAELGVPLPGFLMKVIEKLKKSAEDAGDGKDGK